MAESALNPCTRCNGSGTEPQRERVLCDLCSGERVTCERCGRGMIIGKDGQITELPRIIPLTDPMEDE